MIPQQQHVIVPIVFHFPFSIFHLGCEADPLGQEGVHMDIIIKSPLMQDKIIDTLSGGTFHGLGFSYMGKKGMEMTFSVTGDGAETEDAVAAAKSAIKATAFGKGLFFSVVPGGAG